MDTSDIPGAQPNQAIHVRKFKQSDKARNIMNVRDITHAETDQPSLHEQAF